MVRKHLGYLVVRFSCIINHNRTILAVVAMSKMEADWAKSGNTLYAHTLCAYSVSLNIFYSHCICSFSNCSLCPAPHHQQQKKGEVISALGGNAVAGPNKPGADQSTCPTDFWL